jgi:hypothetical protein
VHALLVAVNPVVSSICTLRVAVPTAAIFTSQAIAAANTWIDQQPVAETAKNA